VVNDAGDVLAVFNAGELVGEAAAATDTPTYRFERTATVRAVGPCELYQIPAESLRRLIEAEPVVRDRVRGLIQERIGIDQIRQHVKSV
jgi:CRP-like cAMP-binding protein